MKTEQLFNKLTVSFVRISTMTRPWLLSQQYIVFNMSIIFCSLLHAAQGEIIPAAVNMNNGIQKIQANFCIYCVSGRLKLKVIFTENRLKTILRSVMKTYSESFLFCAIQCKFENVCNLHALLIIKF
jgi:hypothetical protein